MNLDYKDAARRHWDDAELLLSNQRWPNADQLYGFAAECALKAVMVGLGMTIGPDGRPPRPYAVHIHKLWGHFSAFANGRKQAGYAAMISQSNPFQGWDHNQRYDHGSSILETDAKAHRAGAAEALAVLAQAHQDGLA